MEDRLKERLTGASLLVVLVVVLVPAMFRGERPGAAGAAVVTGGAAPSQVYTIDLKGAAPAAPEPSPATAAQPTILPAEAPAAADEPASPAPAPAIARTPLVRESTPPAATQLAVPTPAPTPAPAPTQARPAAARAPERPQAPVAARGAAGGGFVVQVGSFSRRENAGVMVRQAARKGVRLTVAGPDDRGLFRVRSTVVRTRQEALSLQEKLLAQGYKGLVGAVN